ncbi:hypothetical protein [Pseudoduganella violacea]|uniref:Uncharacterized protein n=1 Tax=Pseudoduganella violacea TaxID=1715466 RepID=A0A7W5BFJ0_9BURK|nr:hypothetical protein [Pseudoduganella violacea]MBB3122204.1 hypothetical protein [Pseudoduganella violacea]
MKKIKMRRVTQVQKVAIRRPGITLEHLEDLAGIDADARQAFRHNRRADVRDRTGTEGPDPELVAERIRHVCYSFIEWRVKMGELCILQ